MDPATLRSRLAAYLPRLLPAWAASEPGLSHREVDGSLVMFDISGFTRLTDRLSRQGRVRYAEPPPTLEDSA